MDFIGALIKSNDGQDTGSTKSVQKSIISEIMTEQEQKKKKSKLTYSKKSKSKKTPSNAQPEIQSDNVDSKVHQNTTVIGGFYEKTRTSTENSVRPSGKSPSIFINKKYIGIGNAERPFEPNPNGSIKHGGDHLRTIIVDDKSKISEASKELNQHHDPPFYVFQANSAQKPKQFPEPNENISVQSGQNIKSSESEVTAEPNNSIDFSLINDASVEKDNYNEMLISLYGESLNVLDSRKSDITEEDSFCNSESDVVNDSPLAVNFQEDTPRENSENCSVVFFEEDHSDSWFY
jgi:hypothetical protein